MKAAMLTGFMATLASVAVAQPEQLGNGPVQARSAKQLSPPTVEPNTKGRELIPPLRQLQILEPVPLQVAKVDPALAKHIRSWPAASRKMVVTICGRYGLPSERAEGLLVWHQVGPWKRIVVHRDPVPHLFPVPHEDILEQVISLDVPIDKIDDLAALDGSLSVRRTRGELAAEGADEAMNVLALNLAHAVITDEHTPADARELLLRSAIAYKRGHDAPLTKGLTFLASPWTGDPDRPTVTLTVVR